HYKKDGVWHAYTWQEYSDKAHQFAKALVHHGFDRFDTIAISGFNSTEWFFAYMGCVLAGGAATGIYTTNSAAACQYVCDNSKARVVVCDGVDQLTKFVSIVDQLPALQALVVYNAEVPAGVTSRVPVYSFDDFLATGAGVATSAIDERVAAQRPGHCASLVYTSGTTGNPKGVMLSHDNMTYAMSGINAGFEPGFFDNNERIISFLPLSHIASQILDIGMQIYYGLHIYFAEPDALKGSLGKTMKEVKPTYFLAVPRVFEKIHEKMVEAGRDNSFVKAMIASAARSVGLSKVLASQLDGDKSVPWGYTMAKLLVFDKVRAALGLDECKALYSGAAPLNAEIASFFASLDMPIFQAMGLSECTGLAFFNYPHRWKHGSLGVFAFGPEAKVDPTTSELLMRGRHVMMGYLGDEAATTAAIDTDGYLHTGDCGSLDADGFGYITGRIKELIITAGGENVPPVLIENVLREEIPILGNAMVVGDKRKFLSVVLTLRVVMDANGAPTDELDGAVTFVLRELGSSATTVAEAIADPKVFAYVDAGLQRANERATSRAQKVQKYIFVAHDFSIPGGEMTPTLKVKRNVVLDKYATEIDTMYQV
ncbi:long-chain-fatty-acid-CoA ligase, partial [Achlya hypogyna]